MSGPWLCRWGVVAAGGAAAWYAMPAEKTATPSPVLADENTCGNKAERIAGVTGIGGTVKRYEVQPDPDRLKQYGITLAALSAALGNSNTNGSRDNLSQGQQTVVVRSG